MRFVSDHSTVKAFLGLSQNPTQSKKIFWVKWSLKGNLGKPLTTHVISHTSIWIGFQNWSKRETVYAMFPSSSFIEISKVCQYCGKTASAHLFSQFELSQTHIAFMISHQAWQTMKMFPVNIRMLPILTFSKNYISNICKYFLNICKYQQRSHPPWRLPGAKWNWSQPSIHQKLP